MSSLDAAQQTLTAQISAHELRAGDLVADRFRIRAVIGMGGMGMVYRAHDEKLDVDVALKLLLPSFAARDDAFARFRRELLLARQISSPHVVRIHDFVAHDGRWLISMDYVDGGSLRQILDRDGRLPVADVVSMGRQMALGLAAAHAQGIVHRDLKPGNVLVAADKRTWITDFGIARSIGVTGLTASGAIVGTPEYLSPEQARGEALDGRSDLYSLGLILYEMLAGRSPFDLGTPAEMLAQRIVRPAPPLRRYVGDVPRWLEQLIMQLLAQQPARRPASADRVAEALATGRAPRQPLSRTALAWSFAALALAAIGTGVWIERHRLLPTLATSLRAARFDVALLPTAGNDAALNRAIDLLLSSDLIAVGESVPPAAQVQRTLDLLGFDAQTALAHPAQLDAALSAREWISIRTSRIDQRIDVSLVRRSDGERRELAGLTASSLPGALHGALAELGVGPVATHPWPADLESLQRLGSGSDPGADLDALLATQRSFSAAWRMRLRLASSDPPAARSALVARAIADLGGVRGRDAELARAEAEALDGRHDAAIARIRTWIEARPQDLEARLRLGEWLNDGGQSAAAAIELDAVLARDPQNPAALLARGRNALAQGDAQSAIDKYLGRAVQLFTRLDDRRGRADTLNALGAAYDQLGQPDPAAEYFAQAAALREALNDARGAAMSWRNLGFGHGVQGRFAAAAAAFERARAQLATIDDKAALADLANDEGLVAEEAGNFPEAAKRYREVLSLRRALDDTDGIVDAALNLGFVLLHSGEYASARQLLDEAERGAQANGSVLSQIAAAQKLAMLDLANGQFAEAEQRLRASLREARSRQLVEQQAVSLAGLGDVLTQRGEIGAALGALDRAAALFADRGDQRGLVEVDLRRARAQLAVEQYDAAATALAPWIESTPSSLEQQAALALLRAQLALAAGDTDAARTLLGQGANAAERSAAAGIQWKAMLIETEMRLRTGKRDAALATLQRYRKRIAEQPAALAGWEAATLDSAAPIPAPRGWPGHLRQRRLAFLRVGGADPPHVDGDADAARLLGELRQSLVRSFDDSDIEASLP